jgi:hypothetical protein
MVNDKIVAIAKKMNASPAEIADMWGLSPNRIEKLMRLRGQEIDEGESLRNALSRHYGWELVQMVETYYQEWAGELAFKGKARTVRKAIKAIW